MGIFSGIFGSKVANEAVEEQVGSLANPLPELEFQRGFGKALDPITNPTGTRTTISRSSPIVSDKKSAVRRGYGGEGRFWWSVNVVVANVS